MARRRRRIIQQQAPQQDKAKKKSGKSMAPNKLPPNVQPKINIAGPSDRFEREADNVADQVVNMPSGEAKTQSRGEGVQMSVSDNITPVAQRMATEKEPTAKGEVQRAEEKEPAAKGEVQMMEEKEPAAKGEVQRAEEKEPAAKGEVQMMEEKEPAAKGEIQRAEEKEPAAKGEVQMMEEKEPAAKGEVQRAEEKEPAAKGEVQMMEEKEPAAKGEVQRAEEKEPAAKGEVQMMEEKEPAAKGEVQRAEEKEPQAKGDTLTTIDNSVSEEIQNARGAGGEMDESTRKYMEQRFGADFKDVNIHNDKESADLSSKLGAQAFAIGNDIFFNTGKYNPETNEGKRLLAHELTHTIQQTGKTPKKSAVSKGKGGDKANASAQPKVKESAQGKKVQKQEEEEPPVVNNTLTIQGPSRLILPDLDNVRKFQFEASSKLPQDAVIKWNIIGGGANAEIVGGASTSEMTLAGKTNGDVTIQVEVAYGGQVFRAQQNVFVTTLTSIQGLENPTEYFDGPVYGYSKLIHYYPVDHQGRRLTISGIRMTEDISFSNLIEDTGTHVKLRMKGGSVAVFPRRNFTFGVAITDHVGRFDDNLRIRYPEPLPQDMEVVVQQVMKANGRVLRINTITYTADGVTVNQIR